MADIVVRNAETGLLLPFDDVAEVGKAAAFVNHVQTAWGEGTLLKPNGAVFTDRTRKPFPKGEYIFRPKPGTTSAGEYVFKAMAAQPKGIR